MHKALKIYDIYREDSVIAQIITAKKKHATFMVYKYICEFWWNDFNCFCPANFFRYYISYIFYASFVRRKSDIIKSLRYAYKVNLMYLLFLLPLIFMVLMLPNLVSEKVFFLFKKNRSLIDYMKRILRIGKI